MSLFGRFIPGLLSNVRSVVLPNPGGLYDVSVRTVIRCHFPRPSERKRIKRHGWKKRMSTPEGRRIIMNRILKGCHVLTH